MSELEDVLNGESEKPEEVPETPEVEEGKETEPEPETKGEEEEPGKEPEKGEEPDEPEKEDEPPSSEDKDTQEPDKSVPVSALQDERRKRQELERQMQELRSQIQNPTDQQKRDFWDDPEGYIQQVQGQTQEQLINHKLQMSEQMARDLWGDDFDAKLETFRELVDQRPYLRDEMVQSAHPAKFVYETAKEHLDLKEIGDVRQYKEKLEADFERRVKEEAEKLRQKALEEEDKLPGSAADARQAAGRSESDKHANATPPSLDEIVQG